MSNLIREVTQIKEKPEKMKGGIIKNAYPLNIDKPRGYQLNTADNKKALWYNNRHGAGLTPIYRLHKTWGAEQTRFARSLM